VKGCDVYCVVHVLTYDRRAEGYKHFHVRWVDHWLTGGEIETWMDGKMAGRRKTECGVPKDYLVPRFFLLLRWPEH
jgi:hypothetical protein